MLFLNYSNYCYLSLLSAVLAPLFHSGCYTVDTFFQRCIELKNGCIFDSSIHISNVCLHQNLSPRRLIWQSEIHHEWRLNNRGFFPASHVRFFSQKFTHFLSEINSRLIKDLSVELFTTGEAWQDWQKCKRTSDVCPPIFPGVMKCHPFLRGMKLDANVWSRWWFQIFFIFIPTWGNDPIWLIFFKWVETTN